MIIDGRLQFFHIFFPFFYSFARAQTIQIFSKNRFLGKNLLYLRKRSSKFTFSYTPQRSTTYLTLLRPRLHGQRNNTATLPLEIKYSNSKNHPIITGQQTIAYDFASIKQRTISSTHPVLTEIITIMFALRQRLLGPATTSVAKRSFRSDLVQHQHQHHASCVSLLATENTTTATRRNASTTINYNHLVAAEESSLGGVFAAAAALINNTATNNGSILTAAVPTTASLPSVAVAMVSNWFVSAWNHDGLFLISTLKRRRKMMNKHKLRKRRKKNRMKNKK